ncbi:MAG: ATP-binding protein [Oribacterium sp.]|nr:ATP-binding protein [Oribacterium sp.]
MTLKEFENVITNGESQTVEFKSWINTPTMKERISLAVDELMAFANANGGTVYFGVEDDGTITGCTKYDCQNLISKYLEKSICSPLECTKP